MPRPSNRERQVWTLRMFTQELPATRDGRIVPPAETDRAQALSACPRS
ncbi:hypothetical protein SACS_0596 [Parasaccharibacter apium]|uniref:Uncharacterized protein n=1 Tax=Parasaccharibacter apium TaxID=1510841 RepID=A0A7U7J0H8_9PROT|nr:hypothetical protein SACS_0596 [Parasaccharibacter apium]